MGRPPCCDKSNVKKGPWTAEEDAKLLAYVASHGTGNWTLVPQKAGLNRCGKSCRLRWTNYLRPDLKHDNFTPQEEDLILEYHKAIGSRWSLIAKQLPGRTDNDVKNHWNTKLKKKLSKMGIDPLTHKPISQLLSDYGSVGHDLPNSRNQNGRSLNNIVPKIEPPIPVIPIDFSSNTNEMLNGRVTEQFQENSSWNSLAHFQAINQETIQPQFFNEVVPSSTSSPFSPCLSQASQSQAKLPSSPSTWNEFLVGDPSLSSDREQECEYQRILPSKSPSDLVQDKASQCHFTYENAYGSDEFKNEKMEAAISSSFVEAILNRDSEMQLEFPQLLDGDFEY